MTAYARPILIEPDQPGAALERVRISGTGETRFSEEWLQRLLFTHPECLPLPDIDPSIGVLIPLCMELDTGAGYADILYVTPLGKIVLVETKLYRNPEARREVIAQILDYARAITHWDFEEINRRVRAASKPDSRGISERVRLAADQLSIPFDESQFIDTINRSLARADILLLIVGDGITSSTKALVEFLEQHGSLHFSFALIEAAVYRTPLGGHLVQPRILARTEIVRRVLLVNQDGAAVEEATPEVLKEEMAADPGSAWYVEFWTEYINYLKTNLDDLRQPLPAKPGRSTNVFLALPPGRSQCWISAYVSKGKNEAGVYLAMGSGYERASEIMEELTKEKDVLQAEIGLPLQWKATWTPFYIGVSTSYSSLEDATERRRVLEFLVSLTNRFVTVFRPRMEQFTNASDVGRNTPF
ncbi:hypothetical protein GCM10027343_43060 [Noviherbaspirillum agri]